MLKIEKVLRIEYINLPKTLRDRIRDRYNFHNDVSLRLHNEVPSKYLLGPLSELTSYLQHEWEVSDEEINNIGLTNLLNDDGNDGLIYEILKLNPDMHEEFDSVIIDVCW